MFKHNRNIQSPWFFFFYLLFSVFLCMFIFILPTPVYSKNYDPGLDWKVLESKHFHVIFPGKSPHEHHFDYQPIAIYVAEIAEETYEQITPQLGEPFRPNRKVAIILEDFSDSVYGFAATIPHRSIRINLTAPGFKQFDTQFENWLKILLVHEYTHLAHFDMTNKATTFLRFFLGQIITPNALQPLWSTEGLAIYNESKWTTGGRLENSRYEMYLRTDFQENQLKTLDQIERSHLVSWPGGNAPYIYGQSLVHFIVQKFGEEKLISISKEFSAYPFLGMNRALKRVLGIDQNELFEQWKKEQAIRYQNQIKQINQFGNITESRQLTNHHYWVDDPLWLPGSNNQSAALLYKVYTPHLYPTIREYNITSKKESILIERTSGHGTSYSLSPDLQYLIYTKLTKYEQYYSYHDLFLYHLKNSKQIRISEALRIKDPAWRPDHYQNHIAAIINQAGSNNLILFSIKQSIIDKLNDSNKTCYEDNTSEHDLLSFSNLFYLTNFDNGTQLSQPVWSPDGNQIALSVWHEGYQNIYLLTFEDNDQIKSFRPITQDKFTDISPAWSPDCQYIYFSSDRSGIFNLYAYALQDEQLFRLTNVTSGVFEPAASPNGKEMAFIQYHASGYELHLINTDKLLWKILDKTITEDGSLFHQIKQRTVPFSPNPGIKEKITSYQVKDYSPRDSIIPTYWTPYVTITSNDLYIGFSSLAQDQLKFYSAPFILAQGLLTQSLYYDIHFTDYTHKPSISLALSGETSHSSRLQATINFPDEGYISQQHSARYFHKNISLGFQNEWHNISEEKNNISEESTRNINSFILRYSYDDTEQYQASMNPEIGQVFSLSYQYANQNIGSDTSFNKIVFDGRKYFPISGQHQVLALRLVAGLSTGELDENELFYLGGNQSNTLLSTVSSDSFPLRGFSPSAFSGKYLITSSLEYRFPIKTVEHKIGFDWASIFLERISGTLFVDIGQVWEGHLRPSLEEINTSLGAEVNFKFKLAYNDPLILTIGAGKALSEPSPFRIYGQIGISF